MKKLFILTFALLTLGLNAQEYYTKEDVTIGWKYWDDSYSWEYLIGNGKPVILSCSPQMNGNGISFTYPTEIVATYLKNNKFLVLSFSKSLGIRLRTENGTWDFSALLSTMEYVQSQMWYEIDFEHIIYDSVFDRIMIPCGKDYNGYYNAICVDFKSSSAVSEFSLEDNDHLNYYDLSGKTIAPTKASGDIIIKNNGKKSVKYFNKK